MSENKDAIVAGIGQEYWDEYMAELANVEKEGDALEADYQERRAAFERHIQGIEGSRES